MKYLIIHGHFYQPPREDPFLSIIPREPSAKPAHDWNERITNECYSPNAYSRVLDEYGRITDIINNYKYLSFNFGPTLLDYIAKERPDVVEKIVEADQASIKRLGFGNAIAQVYNHIIMPLASYEDMCVQIKWGLYNFNKFFKRRSNGMWLSETAINTTVVDALYDCGVTFTILSPFQAQYVKKSNAMSEDVSNATIDTSKPYWLYGNNGKRIAVFFYNADVSRAIAFEHLLVSSDKLKSRIKGAYNDAKMLNIATDGESYGHHEAFADMCLSSFFTDSEKENDIVFTNYEHYLSVRPPKEEVVLHLGANGLGTSWSCSHGVERWRADCGCGSENGLSLSWRKPLRDAFDILRVMQDKLYNALLPNDKSNRASIRESYIMAIYNDEYAKELYKTFEDSITYQEFRFLMDSYKYSLFSYTSCAWFFNDVSRIEPRKNMQYAERSFYYAKKLAKIKDIPFVEEAYQNFLTTLEKSISNNKEAETAREFFENEIKPDLYSELYAINTFAFKLLGEAVSENTIKIYDYQIDNFTTEDGETEGRITHAYEDEKYFHVTSFEDKYELKHLIKIANTKEDLVNKENHTFSLKDVELEERNDLAEVLFVNSIDNIDHVLESILPEFEGIFSHYNINDIIPNYDYRRIMGSLYSPILRAKIDSQGREAYNYVTEKLTSMRSADIFVSNSGISLTIVDKMKRTLKEIEDNSNMKLFDKLIVDIKFLSENNMPTDRHKLENMFYIITKKYKNGQLKIDESEKKNYIELGNWLNFNMSMFS